MKKMYHRSRKGIILFLMIIFISSVETLHLRAKQRDYNFRVISEIIHEDYKAEDNHRLFKTIDYLTKKSLKEDMELLIKINFSSFLLFLLLDRIGIFEKTGDTYREKKLIIKEKILGKKG